MRRYLLYFSATVFSILLLTAFLGLIFEPFEPLTGDLTRIGNYAEKDFGWNAPQPVIQIAANGKAITNPDILVLGDSFSKDNVWQSVTAAKTHQQILSFEIAHVGCISHWFSYALNHPTAKTIVIESVERSFLANFKNLTKCNFGTPEPFETHPWVTAPSRKTWPPEWHIQRTFKLSYKTLLMKLHPDSIVRDAQVTNAPIDRKCANFSNRRSDRLLYFSQDEEKFRWARADIDRAISNITAMQQSAKQHGKKFVLLLVPDKQSAYQRCLLNAEKFASDKGPDITASLVRAGVRAPDLLNIFQKNVGKIMDLYRPDDTHLSEAGYILMGEKIAQFLNNQSSRFLWDM